MFLVLCSSTDSSALWAYEGLRRGGLDIELLTTEALSSCTLWEHHVGDGVRTSCRLPDGRTLDSRAVRGVLNRLMAPPPEMLSYAVPGDREYAMQEMSAFYLSWLHGLTAAVLNPPTPQGLGGRWRHASEWAIAAHEAGFTVPKWRQTAADPPEPGYIGLSPRGAPETNVVVLDDEVFGADLPDLIRRKCVTLAARGRTPLLGIRFFAGMDDPWTFAMATPMPELQAGGARLLSKLAGVFQNGGGR